MKFTKLSLVAALLAGSSAFAIDNVKVSGDAKLFYSTNDMTYDSSYNKNGNGDLLDRSTSMGEAAVSIGLTADLTSNVSAGVKGTVITTLGLYNNLVSSTWTGGTEDTYVIEEAWLASTMGKTTVKVGRMPLDTPLVFSEQWSIVPNTFEAGVVINQDIPDTTLVGAYVGQHDSAKVLPDTGAGISQANSPFSSFYSGAYAVGVVNNSFKPLTVQGWYYGAQADVDASLFTGLSLGANAKLSHVDAYWLQADLACQKVPGLLAGAQYTALDIDVKNVTGVNAVKNDAYALMLGYEMKDVATVKVAYSQVGKTNEEAKATNVGAGFNLASMANNDHTFRGAAQSKLYTEAWWSYGYVTRADTSAISVSAEGTVVGTDLGAYYTKTDSKLNGGTTERADMQEFTVTASRSYGPLDATLAYIYTKADDLNKENASTKGAAFNTVQAYLTVNF